MFKLADFQRELNADNPTFGRILRSDLHEVVALVSRTGFTVQQLAAEMKKVSAEKWLKYVRTKAYLLREFPLLATLLRGKLVDFRTVSLTKGGAGAIVHVLGWKSDTGSLADLAHLRVRERIVWPAPAPAAVPYLIPEYRVAGEHFGMGNAVYTQGSAGRGDDTHAALGPFGPPVLTFAGPGSLEYVIAQTYEQSDNAGGTWTAIPDSAYTIRRVVTRVGPKTRLTITKTNNTKPGDTLTNSTDV